VGEFKIICSPTAIPTELERVVFAQLRVIQTQWVTTPESRAVSSHLSTQEFRNEGPPVVRTVLPRCVSDQVGSEPVVNISGNRAPMCDRGARPSDTGAPSQVPIYMSLCATLTARQRSDLRNFYLFAECAGPRQIWRMFLSHGNVPSRAALLPRTGLRVCHRHHRRGGSGDWTDRSPYAKSQGLQGLCA
jgi:hypothetical protein